MSDVSPDLDLAAGFAPATEVAWRALVAKVLKGADFERRLSSRTDDGLRIAPLYTRQDSVPGADLAAPGSSAATRGLKVKGAAAGWTIRQIHASADPRAVTAAVREDAAGGARSLVLQMAAPGQFGLAPDVETLRKVLDGVDLATTEICLSAGGDAVETAGCLLALWDERGVPGPMRRGALGFDPIGRLATTGALAATPEQILAAAARRIGDLRAAPAVTIFRADGPIFNSGGASAAQELACVLGSVVADLRACELEGIAPVEALPRIEVAVAVDCDLFAGIAKLRALRRLLRRLAEATSALDALPRVVVAATTSWRMMTRRDPWVNLLRTTVACAAAGTGGADVITVLPYTWALGQPDGFARRIARNTHHVLMAESGLARVADPAGGSWYVERLSEDLAQRAWAIFQEIEAAGGIVAALQAGRIQHQISATAQAQQAALATGRRQLVGTTAFPMLAPDGVSAEPWPPRPSIDQVTAVARVVPLEMKRLSEPFEALRDRADWTAAGGAPPVVFLANLGPPSEHGGRADWIANFLAAGGLGVARADGDGITSSPEAGAAFARSGARIACICACDATLAELGESVVMALKAAGAVGVWLAGRPGPHEAALRAAGVDGFIVAGCDSVEMLTTLHDSLASA